MEQLLANFWNPITCFAVCILIFAFSEFLAHKTHGNVSLLVFVCLIFLICYWTGILPKDAAVKPGLAALMTNFGIAVVLTDLGTRISLEEMIGEWKTVLVAALGLLGIAVAAFTVGSWLFGREYALCAAPPISGGTVATVLVQQAAEAAGRPELGAFAFLVVSCQKFFGMPVATLSLKREATNKLKSGYFDTEPVVAGGLKLPSMRFIPDSPAYMKTPNWYLTKLALVSALANMVGLATRIPGDGPENYILNPNIACLLFGLIFTRIGFLEKNSLAKSHSTGITMLGLMWTLPISLASVSPSAFLDMIIPVAGMFIFSIIGIIIIASIVGKLVGYSPYLSTAIACTCMMGYPSTEILPTEVVNSYTELTPEQKERMGSYLIPKMVVGGFVTVTIASVAFASIVCPMIFS